MGLRKDEVSPQLIDDTITLYPRLGFKKAFAEALAENARKKPHTAIGASPLSTNPESTEDLSTVEQRTSRRPMDKHYDWRGAESVRFSAAASRQSKRRASRRIHA